MEIPFAKAEFGIEEKEAVNRVLNSPLLASGPENEAFEKEFAEYVGSKFAVCVNSGSSANLLALASLGLHKGAQVLTSACGFPATLSPILHLGLQPVLIDYDLKTHNIDIKQLIFMISNVDAVIVAHTLGNPVDMELVKYIADIFGVPVIEDCCEAVGSKLYGKHVGTFGALGTYSFYPAHQITALGGGGMVVTDDESLYRRMKSLRDWGKKYDWDSGQGGVLTDYKQEDLLEWDEPYYKGYTYETIGWNFKLPEANAAFGRVQLRKLDQIREKRIQNHRYLLKKLQELPIDFPVQHMMAEPSWFGFCMSVTDRDRNHFGKYLETEGIRHRPFFAGNITRHKCFNIKGEFPVADKLMKNTLFIGCWPGMTQEMLDYIVEKIHAYIGITEFQW